MNSSSISGRYHIAFKRIKGIVILTMLAMPTSSGCGGDGDPDPTNTPPNASAGTDQDVTEGDSVQLRGSGSDSEGSVTYLWSQTSGTSVSLSGTTSATASFTAPDVSTDETLVFSLTVTDEGGLSDADTVNITVRNDSSATTAGNYLFYLGDNGELGAVDPADPANPILVNTDTLYAEIIESSDYDGTAKTTRNRHFHALVYADADGHLYKVYADHDTPLTPKPISNESAADTICIDDLSDDPGVPDFLDPEASQFVYVLAGPDTECNTGDEIWKMVRLNMDATTSPIGAYRPVQAIMDSATGELSGWLVDQTDTLSHCDRDFRNCSAITSYELGFNLMAESLDYFMLEVDSTLRSYDIANRTLSASLFDFPLYSWPPDYIEDGSNLYFSVGASLYTVPLDGSSAASLMTTTTNPILSVELSGSRVIIATAGAATDEIRAIPRTGGASDLLAAASGDNHLFVMSLSEDYVYYNERRFVENPDDPYWLIPVVAGVVAANGSSRVEYAGAAWSGETMKTTWDLSAGYSRSHLADKIILVEGYELAGASGGYSGATVTAFEAATAQADYVLGTLTTTEGITNMVCTGYTKVALCETDMEITPAPKPPAQNYQGEIYTIDSTAANSLTRTTTTPRVHDIPASYL